MSSRGLMYELHEDQKDFSIYQSVSTLKNDLIHLTRNKNDLAFL